MLPRRLSETERAAIAKRATEKLRDGTPLTVKLLPRERVTMKSAESAQENTVSNENYAIIENTSIAELRKALDVMTKGMRAFMMTPDGMKELDRDAVENFLLSVAGHAEDATRAPEHPASSFPGSASIVDRPANEAAPRPVAPPYQFDEPNVWTRVGPNFIAPNADPNIAPANDFEAGEPGDRPQGPAPEQMRDAGTDLTSQIVKSAAVRGRMGVSFANLVDQSTSR